MSYPPPLCPFWESRLAVLLPGLRILRPKGDCGAPTLLRGGLWVAVSAYRPPPRLPCGPRPPHPYDLGGSHNRLASAPPLVSGGAAAAAPTSASRGRAAPSSPPYGLFYDLVGFSSVPPSRAYGGPPLGPQVSSAESQPPRVVPEGLEAGNRADARRGLLPLAAPVWGWWLAYPLCAFDVVKPPPFPPPIPPPRLGSCLPKQPRALCQGRSQPRQPRPILHILGEELRLYVRRAPPSLKVFWPTRAPPYPTS